MEIQRNPTRAVRIGTATIGGGCPITVQSMTATHTQDIDATVAQTNALAAAGADLVRIAVDSKKDADALVEIRRQTRANLSVDLQENYRLAALVAPHVDEVRYNPGHLYHHEPEKPWQEKVRFLAQVARDHDCALRVGVNCGSVDPAKVGAAGVTIPWPRCWPAPGSIAIGSTNSALSATTSRSRIPIRGR